MIELKVPTVGESVSEVQVGQWLKGEGDAVAMDESVVVLETDKATMEVPAPAAGVIAKLRKRAGDMAKPGDVLADIEPNGKPAGGTRSRPPAEGHAAPPSDTPREAAKAETSDGKRATSKAAPAPETRDRVPIESAPQTRDRVPTEPAAGSRDTVPTEPAPATRDRVPTEPAAGSRDRVPTESAPRPPALPPSKRRAMHEQAAQPGSGAGPSADPAPPTQPTTPSAAPTTPTPSPAPGRQEDVVPMTMMRRRIAERLVEAQQHAALVSTFNEIDMSAVMALREKHRQSWLDRHGLKLGFMSFFVKATIDALQRCPQLNAELRDNHIIYRNYYDIGIAVGGGRGLVVPVLRNAERLSFADIELAIADFGKRARDNKLSLDELAGGTFSISNGGIYGSLLSTPIINPPQSGILGLHAIQERPVGRDGHIVLRPMMYVALTYDHRLVDGREAVGFLVRVKECIEDPSRMLLEI
jgi:2-oxoglutarate dehydrogenase E2 component (dihydrolipoamide succinyltransferase)